MLSKATSLLLGILALLAILMFRKHISRKRKDDGLPGQGSAAHDPFVQEPVRAGKAGAYDPSDEPSGSVPEEIHEEERSLNVHDISPLEEYLDPATSPQRKKQLAEEFRALGYNVSGTSPESVGNGITDGIDEQYDRPSDL